MANNTEDAFKWIVGLLVQNDIPFQISGGFAANLYGANRPLFDIDIDIKGRGFDKLLPFVGGHIISGPKRHLDDSFDLELLTLEYEGQRIDLSASENSRIFNSGTGQWQECRVDFEEFQEFDVYGLKVPVIMKQELIDYKKTIGRPTDLEDVSAMGGQ